MLTQPEKILHKYTVVLLRPEYLAVLKYGQDVYVCMTKAESVKRALFAAQLEVFAIDKKGGLKPKAAADYTLCVMFRGHHSPVSFGWQYIN